MKETTKQPSNGSLHPIVLPRAFVRMFKPQFAPLVESGDKRQTVRPLPKRMPNRGDTISLRCWEGKPYRSKQRILREAVITEVSEVTIEPDRLYCHDCLQSRESREIFAMSDGFGSWNELTRWFRDHHGLPFYGVLIQWENDSDETTRGEDYE